MLTMVIGGFWHGAAWNFLLWGFYHGTLLAVHRFTKPWLDAIFDYPDRTRRLLSGFLRWAIMFHLTCYGWLLFRAKSMGQIIHMTSSLFGTWNVDEKIALGILVFAAPLIVVQLVQLLSGKLAFLDWPGMPAEVRVVCYSVCLYCVLFRGGSPQSFIYFQF